MPLQKSKIHNILVISLTNIGDVILTFPVVDILKNDFPDAKLSILIGPKAQSLLEANPSFEKVYIYNKHQSFLENIRWLGELRRQNFDLIVDLRNTAIPFFVPTQYRTPLRKTNSRGLHMREKHLARLRSIYPNAQISPKRYSLFISEETKAAVRKMIDKDIGSKPFVVIAPGAMDNSKRWTEKNFALVADELVKTKGVGIVFVGGAEDRHVAQSIGHLMESEFVNLCGRTTLLDLAELMNHCQMVIANDSAPMHLASYLDKPVLAIFGPTDPAQYGPWSSQSLYVEKKKDCQVCHSPKLKTKHECINNVSAENVLEALKSFEFSRK
ncbi:MAG: glycosyltransferase family 9 protein [Candidatus Omnitrophica bacterium]|nr:glycosyltransferase family 9 protein [Candidatus Omnitrophota bacterium]